MSRFSALVCLVASTLLALVSGCAGLPSGPEIDASADHFSPARARAHFETLGEIGSRSERAGASERAHAYLAQELTRAGARVVASPGPRGTLVAERAGRSEDRVLIVAPWLPEGGQDGPDDSGVATLLELARALSRNPPPYGLIFVAAGAPALPEAPVGGAPNGRRAVGLAGDAVLQAIGGEDALEGLRAVLIVEPRATGGVRIARDLRSHPVFRELFWTTAARLGYDDSFPPEAGWDSPKGVQAAFLAVGFGRVLSLVDVRTIGAGEGQGASVAASSATGPSFASLGVVAYEGLTELMQRFERVDAFSE